MADVYYLKVIAIVNGSSSEGPSGHTNSVFMRKDKSGYQTTVKIKKKDVSESDLPPG